MLRSFGKKKKTQLGSGHLHWDNWGLIIKHISMLSHWSDCSREVINIITDSQLADFGALRLTQLVTDNAILYLQLLTTVIMSIGPSFHTASVQNLVFNEAARSAWKIFVWRQGYSTGSLDATYGKNHSCMTFTSIDPRPILQLKAQINMSVM